MNTTYNMRFSELTCIFEKICRCNTSFEKKSLLIDFILHWREISHSNETSSSNIVTENLQSFYPVMRLILPSLDKVRHAYGIKEIALAKFYCDILCLSSESPDAKKLTNFKSPENSRYKRTDFAAIVFDVLKNRSPEKGSITIEEINNRLDNIAEANGQSRKDIINQNLIFLFQNTTALEQKWLIRVILKDISLGISSKTIFHCFHPLAEDLYNVSNDLEAVCNKFLLASDEHSKSFEIDLFKPFKPMLSNRVEIANILHEVDNKKFIHEIKFDGERVQLQKNGSHYRYWSRSGLEWTNSYGERPTSGTLTPFIHSHFKSSVINCILDGEMMGYNVLTNTIGSKADNFDVKSLNIKKTGYMPCFIVFDIVYLNYKVLTQTSLLKRKEILQNEVLECELEGKIQIAKWAEVVRKEDCIDAFNKAIENCEEGLIIKQAESEYKVNCRAGGWFKLKPDYVLGLHEELDCVIVGGYFSLGGAIRSYLCAVKADNNQDQYYTFTRVNSGFNRKVIRDYNLKLEKSWKLYKEDDHPSWLVLSSTAKEKPDVYVLPENSFIIQLKAAEIIASDSFATDCTLRFARIDCFRDDKSPTSDCMTIEELKQLRFAHKGKLALHPLEIQLDHNSSQSTTVQTKNRQSLKRFVVAENFRSTVPTKKANDLTNSNSIFSGKEFCILLSNIVTKDYDKKQLEAFVYSNGGVVVQNPSGTTVVIADKVTVKIQNLMKNNKFDIISVAWLMDCVKQNRFVEIRPSNYYCMKKVTSEHYKDLFDVVGDSYTEELSIDEMKMLMKEMDSKSTSIIPYTPKEKSIFIDEILNEDDEYIFLNGCVIFLFVSSQSNHNVIKTSEIERLTYSLMLAGAIISDDISNPEISHVVLTTSTSDSELNHFHALNRERPRKFYLVSWKWVVESINIGSRINERFYFLKTN